MGNCRSSQGVSVWAAQSGNWRLQTNTQSVCGLAFHNRAGVEKSSATTYPLRNGRRSSLQILTRISCGISSSTLQYVSNSRCPKRNGCRCGHAQGFGGYSKRAARPTKRQDSKAAMLRQVEQKMKAFDLQQHKVAVQIPAGPQRIRGLAGTGKTVVLAQKAAYMHVNYPEWEILFTSTPVLFMARFGITSSSSCRSSLKSLSLNQWSRVLVLYGCGASDQPGLYRELCRLSSQPFRLQ